METEQTIETKQPEELREVTIPSVTPEEFDKLIFDDLYKHPTEVLDEETTNLLFSKLRELEEIQYPTDEIKYREKTIKTHIVNHNQGFAYYWLKEVLNRDPSFREIQSALIGLFDATKDYDPAKGKFTTYSASHMFKNLYDFWIENDVIKIPANLTVKVLEYQRFQEEFKKTHSRLPNTNEIANQLDLIAKPKENRTEKQAQKLTKKRVEYIKKLQLQQIPVYWETLDENLPDYDFEFRDPDLDYIAEIIGETLSSEQMEIILLKFVYHFKIPEIAELRNLTVKEVRSIEQRALRLLKKPIHIRKIRGNGDRIRCRL